MPAGRSWRMGACVDSLSGRLGIVASGCQAVGREGAAAGERPECEVGCLGDAVPRAATPGDKGEEMKSLMALLLITALARLIAH